MMKKIFAVCLCVLSISFRHTGQDSGKLCIIISKSWFAAASHGKEPRGEKLSTNGIIIPPPPSVPLALARSGVMFTVEKL